jgi:hypothetical protein
MTTDPTAVDLGQIEAAMAKATPGPWKAMESEGEGYIDAMVIGSIGLVLGTDGGMSPADTVLAVAAVNALPALLAELRTHRARAAAEGESTPDPFDRMTEHAMRVKLTRQVGHIRNLEGSATARNAEIAALRADVEELRRAAAEGAEAVAALRVWGRARATPERLDVPFRDLPLVSDATAARYMAQALADRLAQQAKESPDVQ